ncbi:MAG: hypothetical protein H0U57_03590 [Tatlockia sp.]|nr:hypothetical protein [Tatlockia sp.]
MIYYSANDLNRTNPYTFDPETLTLSSFLKFYAWWFDKPIQNLSGFAVNAVNAASTEELSKLLIGSKKECRSFALMEGFFPEWFIFRPINDWLNQFIVAELEELINKISPAIDDTLARNTKIYTSYQKMADIDAENGPLIRCLEHHQKEISAQPYNRPKETYADLRKKVEESQSKIKNFRNHRDHVKKVETPVGKTRFYSNGANHYVYNDPPTRDQLKSLETHLDRIDSDINFQANVESKLIQQIKAKFFLSNEFDNPDKYKKLLDDRTNEALKI